MESKKNISQLFRENLGQLDYAPSDKVWVQIESDLKKKKKRRRLIIWLFFAGIIAIGLGGLAHTFWDGHLLLEKTVKENPVSNHKAGKNTVDSVAATAGPEKNASEKAVADNDPDKQKEENPTDENSPHTTTTANGALKHKLQKNTTARPNLNSAPGTFSAKRKKTTQKRETFLTVNTSAKDSKKTNVAIVQKENAAGQKETQAGTTKTVAEAGPSQQPKQNPEKLTITDSLIAAATNKETVKKDRKQKDSLVVNDTVADMEKKIKPSKITVAPYVGVNYGGYLGAFNSLSNNRILENKGEMRLIYGISLRWMFSEKLGFQTGIGKINSRQFTTVEKTDYPFINTQNVATDIPNSELMGIFANETQVKFTYESSYVEVPLEAYYVIRDKKLGAAVSFGMGMLFGGKNSVFAESENVQKMKIGKLTTDREGGFTANAKLYLFYKITPALQFDLYPSFQYQLMGNTDSGYSKYFLSLRTGLSYKF